ncbi:phage tail protein [Saccharothrix sp. ST-888]|uniref:phage tail protein n=1 Tax=Saccharothrix sp. ST-888 TaxID=1427391 RepID=UPI0005ED2322|nr:phage tail protein [Saccharothrix sp. ST-888]KJK55527.1 hypothetical protein UK12_28085 [Saccharothrix sp. ST-888]
MAIYGLDLYGKSTYGAPPPAAFDASPMVAAQTGHGVLQITWATPRQAYNSSVPLTWSRLRLVRNAWGVPDAEDDGWICVDVTAGDGTVNNPPQLVNSFVDAAVVPGRYYYYAVFVAATVSAYSATATYQPGDLAAYGGQNWQCLAVNTTGVTPSSTSPQWSSTNVTTPWYRCGSGCVGLVVPDAGYGQLLYDLVPRPYKVATVETTASEVPVNTDLLSFLSVFGFHFDIVKAENDALVHLNDITACTDRQLSLIAQQLGIAGRLPALPALRRAYVRDAMAIQRGSGSAGAVAQLVRDVTGWNADVAVGYNELPTMDAAAFASTRAQPWNSALQYVSAYTGVGDLVTYQGSVYQAVNGTVVYPLYGMQSSVTATGSNSTYYVRDPALGPIDLGYAWWQNAHVGDTLTVTFTVTQPPQSAQFQPMAVWSAQLMLQFYMDPSCGIVSVALNGTPIPNFAIDLYAPTRQLGPVIQVPGAVSAGTNRITLTVTGRDGVSSGCDVLWAHMLVVPFSGLNIGITPSPTSAFWSVVPPGSLIDSDTLRTWLTDGQSVWNLQDPAGVINARADNDRASTTTMPWGVVPYGAAVGSGSPGPGNSLAYTLPSGATGTGSVSLYTGGGVQAGYWNNTSGPAITKIYQAGQPAALGQYTGEQQAIYTALTYTRGDYPPASPTKWRITSLANNLQYEPSIVQSQTVPVAAPPVWYPYKGYQFGDVVSWNGHLYQAAQPTQVNAPTGLDTDNPWWRWLGPETQNVTFSIYHYRTSTAAGQNVRLELDWFDQTGTYLGNATVKDARQLLLDRFEVDNYTFPASSGGAPAGWTTPQPWQQGTGAPWVCDWGSWTSNTGVGFPSAWTRASGTGTATNVSVMQAGRALFFKRDWVYSGPNGDTVYATFRSQPVDTSGTPGGPYTMEHGIVVRYGGGQYILASRDRLTWAKITYDANSQPTGGLTGANLSVLATWTPLADGTRMRVKVSPTQITVEAMTSATPGAWTQLANVTNNTNNTQNGMGFLERVRP